jgi:Uma2 family endonuclease
MTTIVSPHHGVVRIPSGITDLAAFRDWVHFARLPEKLPVHFLRGEVWADFSRSEPLANVLIRGALVVTLHGLAKVERGWFATAGMLWSNDEAGFATLPDGFFISRESYRSGRVRFSNGGNPAAEATEVIGTPDLVVEIVSDVSQEKDTDWMRTAYHEAGVPEYWLIDARRSRLAFDVYNRRKAGYHAARRTGGWVKSVALRQSFRLRRGRTDDFPQFTLETR